VFGLGRLPETPKQNSVVKSLPLALLIAAGLLSSTASASADIIYGSTVVRGQTYDLSNMSNDRLAYADYSYADLTGIDLMEFPVPQNNNNYSYANLTSARLSGNDFIICNLSHANLTGVWLNGSILNGSDFSYANLTNALLISATFNPAWIYVNGEVNDIIDINLTHANLTGADLTDANMDHANLTSATLTDADLSGAILTDADLSGAILYDTILTGANLSNAYLYGTNLTGANLTNATLTGVNMYNTNLTGVTVSYSNWDDFKNNSGVNIIGNYAYNTSSLIYANAPVPEPSTYGLIGIGALGVAFAARRRKLKTA
jgi:uncharacterized protein YjbI with pentapeptide repeats